MTQALKDETLEQILMDIQFGFETPEELFDGILDMFYTEKDFDKKWLRKTIDEKYQAHLLESKSWARPTDFDRLANAFDTLIARGIVCLHKAGYTMQDGIGDCEETIDKLNQLGIPVKGFCFYHTQDLMRAIDPETSNLLLGFDSAGKDDESVAVVGNTIVQILLENNLKATWSGNLDQRIEIKPICWQKVPDSQNWKAERVMSILVKDQPPKKPFWKFW